MEMHVANMSLSVGQLGFQRDRQQLDWLETQWHDRGLREYPWTLSCMQASLTLHPDFWPGLCPRK